MAHDEVDLDTRIALAERQVIERDERLRARGKELVTRVERGVKRVVGPGLLTAVAGLLLARWLPGRRHAAVGPAPPPAAPAVATGWSWAALVPALWPLLPPPLRRHVSPAMAAGLLPVVIGGFGSLWPARAAVQTAPEIDLSRFAGRWHEIARLGAPSGGAGASGTTTTYTPRGATVEIDKRWRGPDGHERHEVGVAYPVEGSRGARLEISLFPRWLRWLPFAWTNHWILAVDRGYQIAVVGTPDRRGLWLLARSPRIDEVSYQSMAAHAAEQGYDVGRLRRIDGQA